VSAAPLQFLLLVFAGWVNRRQREVVEYLQEASWMLEEAGDGLARSRVLLPRGVPAHGDHAGAVGAERGAG
jgi:hypothetical protein